MMVFTKFSTEFCYFGLVAVNTVFLCCYDITSSYDVASSTLIDVDECSGGSARCSQDCMNTIGSFTCDCGDAYMLDSNGFCCTGRENYVQTVGAVCAERFDYRRRGLLCL